MAMVVMTHPETGGVAHTTEEAFKLVWEPRGWQLADPVDVAVGEVLGVDVSDVDDLSKEQLLEVAATLGVEGAASSTKKELAAGIRARVAPMVEADRVAAEPAEVLSDEPSTATRRTRKA
jgi:ABC-type taurine transport system ATPase subunit